MHSFRFEVSVAVVDIMTNSCLSKLSFNINSPKIPLSDMLADKLKWVPNSYNLSVTNRYLGEIIFKKNLTNKPP